MRKFLSGFLCATLAFGLISTALAASGRMTIEVDPINIMVNGEVFEPKDVDGNPVPCFAYNGTTMAPLRALAEAYGLAVGYDAAQNMATVTGDTTPADPKPVASSAPDTTAKVEPVVLDENGEEMMGCKFDTAKVYINGTQVNSDTPVIIEIWGGLFRICFEEIAPACGIDSVFDGDRYIDYAEQTGNGLGGYLTYEGRHYVSIRVFDEIELISRGKDILIDYNDGEIHFSW